MNVVILSGRLTRDPELRYSSGESQVAICTFTLAVDRQKRDGGADFLRCIAFGKQGENIQKFMSKGRQMNVVGHMQTGSYEDKDGKTVYTTDVIVDRSEFIGGKSDAPDNSGTVNQGQQMEIPAWFETIDESDVPF